MAIAPAPSRRGRRQCGPESRAQRSRLAAAVAPAGLVIATLAQGLSLVQFHPPGAFVVGSVATLGRPAPCTSPSTLCRSRGGGADAESPESEAWAASTAVLVDTVDGCTAEDADQWLREGFAWTVKSRRFWRKARSQAQPDAADVAAVAGWLKEKGLARREWITRFPQVVGLTVEELERSRATAPSYLKTDETYLRAITANPPLLGKNYDCLENTESCQGQCSRCWNS